MIEINLSNINKTYGFKKLFDNFDLEISSGERVALIGPNGCGKTTLFNIINNLDYIDSGNIAIRKGATIGYLSQIPPNLDNDVTVKQVLSKTFEDLFLIENKMRNYEYKLSKITDNKELEKILNSYGLLQEKYLRLGGYEINEKLGRICNGFKINDNMLDRKFNSLSGGEKTIVNLASIIIGNPDILLLDEPTNHLDIDTLEWFENFLNNYKGTVLISSHDRYFLDKVVNKTVLIDRGKTEIFFGNYSYYLVENERRILSEFEDYKDQQKQIAAMKASIKRLQEFGRLAAPGGEIFFKRAANIQRRLDKIELIDKPDDKKDLPLDFKIENRSGKDVLNIKNLSLSIGDKHLFSDANMFITFGDKTCLMGKNGTGKSTLIKMILNNSDAKLLDGNISLGTNVEIGYLPQEIKFDNERDTILDYSRKFFIGSETELRATLAKFMFYGENVFKKVGNLSGGEKVRLKLLELIQTKANLLILDEPTNHIDIDTREVLEEALSEYKGSILFISHDRFFINKLSKQIYNIEDNKIVMYLGNYDDYKIKHYN